MGSILTSAVIDSLIYYILLNTRVYFVKTVKIVNKQVKTFFIIKWREHIGQWSSIFVMSWKYIADKDVFNFLIF